METSLVQDLLSLTATSERGSCKSSSSGRYEISHSGGGGDVLGIYLTSIYYETIDLLFFSGCFSFYHYSEYYQINRRKEDKHKITNKQNCILFIVVAMDIISKENKFLLQCFSIRLLLK